MAFTRKNVWELGGDWADPTILWYARGVKAMKARALSDRTSWWFFGAMHGFDRALWQQVGQPTGPLPSQNDINAFWRQCQHGSWYFLPWHRGYLLAFEAFIRYAIASLSGASADWWALPYWNYFKPNQNGLPPAFASPNWPDGQGDNPLYVEQRYGPDNNGNVYVPLDQINENALGDPQFVGPGQGGSQGFGGVVTGFHHANGTHGGIETQPHDWVHGLVGGALDDQRPGLMSDPDLAGLDPIFWLHHANIDRLWEVWRRMPTSLGNPQASNWLEGPAAVGQRSFVMPWPGNQIWTYTPNGVKDLSGLGYDYDDTSPPATAPQLARRLQLLTASLAAPLPSAGGPPPMPKSNDVELLGANSESVRLVGPEARTRVALDNQVKQKVAASLLAARETTPPDRVFLNLENVRGLNDATAFNVYINVPEGEDPARHPECRAGGIALFGVRAATQPGGEHAGNGLNFVLEITPIVDRLHLAGALDAAHLDVRLVPRHPVSEAAQISIGRISVFRQGH